MDEFDLIERLRQRFEGATETALSPPSSASSSRSSSSSWVEVGIGDDGAVVVLQGGDRLVLSVDAVVEGVHFDLDLGDLEDAGWKAVMVATSDLAAMGAVPGYALVSVAAPPGLELDRFGAGLAEGAARLGVRVVGGDLTAGPALCCSVTVVGLLAPDEPPLRRAGALPGDAVFVTGPLGGAAAGLRLLQAGGTVPEALALAYRRPHARVAEGRAARTAGARATVDVSDGLAADIRHLAAASSVGIVLDEVPVAEGATTGEALGGGEDYELVLTCPDPDRLREAFAAVGLRLPIEIGRCTDQAGEVRLGDGPLPEGGWHHRF